MCESLLAYQSYDSLLNNTLDRMVHACYSYIEEAEARRMKVSRTVWGTR